MYVDEPPKDGNIPDFNISKINICPFRVCQRSFRLFHGNFSKGIHLRSRLLCFTQHDHTGHAGFKICPLFKVGSYMEMEEQCQQFHNNVNDVREYGNPKGDCYQEGDNHLIFYGVNNEDLREKSGR